MQYYYHLEVDSMAKSEQELLNSYKDRIKRQNERTKEKYDKITATLPKGTIDRIKELGISTNKFINSAVSAELKKSKNRKTQKKKWRGKMPDKINGKPVYRDWQEDEYIQYGDQWWHEVVFFYDDMELNDLFIKFLDNEAKENDNHKDGCNLLFTLVNLQREVSKISDKEVEEMTEEEYNEIPEELLEETIDQNDQLKAILRDCINNNTGEPLFEFIGLYELG